jgi:hypothetical protein
MITWLYRHGLRCHHVDFVPSPSGRWHWRCERWLHLGGEHR